MSGSGSGSASLRVDIFTIFPELVEGYCSASIIGRARRSGIVDVAVHDLRSQASDPHRSVDDAPFGGGAGMVLSAEPILASVESVPERARPLIALSPSGRPFSQVLAREYRALGGISLLCGRYEGVDQRIADHLVDGELSVGDVVLAGGELAALVVVEAVSRLVPGVLGNEASSEDESFGDDGVLEYPQYTRPAEFRGWKVPEVLLSGHHGQIARWRRAQALRRTLDRRPDLIDARGGLREADVALLAEFDLG